MTYKPFCLYVTGSNLGKSRNSWKLLTTWWLCDTLTWNEFVNQNPTPGSKCSHHKNNHSTTRIICSLLKVQKLMTLHLLNWYFRLNDVCWSMQRVKYGEVYIADTFVNIAFLGKRGLNDFSSLNLLPPLSLAPGSVACTPRLVYTTLLRERHTQK